MLLNITPWRVKGPVIVNGSLSLSTRSAFKTMIPAMSSDTSGGFTLTSSTLYTANPSYWQRYYAFKADDSGVLTGVSDQANAGYVTSGNVPQWLQFQFPEMTWVDSISFCWIRNDIYACPWKDFQVIIDGTTTYNQTFATNNTIGQSSIYVMPIRRALQTIRFSTTNTWGNSGLQYVHDIGITGHGIDKRTLTGTLNSGMHDVTVSGTNVAFGTKSYNTGKRYFEIQNLTFGGSSSNRGAMVGVATSAGAPTGDGASNSSFYSVEFGKTQVDLCKDRGGTASISAASYDTGVNPSYGGVLVDFDAGTMGIITPGGERIDNVYTGITAANYFPLIAANGALYNNTERAKINFGASPFHFTLPSGYKAWCDL